jgi:hypothetical protein
MSAAIPTYAIRTSGTRTIEGRQYDCPELLALSDDEADAIQIAETQSRKRHGKLVIVDSNADPKFSVAFLNGKRFD